jgi:adhesin transport system outer membrane protein
LTLKDAAQRAVLTNPEVLSRWHTIKAAEGERDSARGALLPRVDLTAAAGPERRSDLGRNSRTSGSLSISQLLYDGFASRNELLRLDHTSKVRLFEFFETSEAIALEATRAYFDVVRYRELVRLAEDNFVEHRAVYSQTERRVNAKVARAVDLEQVSGRLALAEANLLTETANLHDTTARFQRLVGRLPTQEMPIPPHLARDIPGDPVTAITAAQQRNGSLLAAIENVRASQAALASRGGANTPRLDARVRREQGTNNLAALGSSNSTAAELVLSWNLFNGFGDRARERQFAEQVNVAKDLRDKTCRDIRQTLIIAYNDINKLKEQLEYLVVHETAVGKALTAYRLQFDIGQRTLLDLLDTENELFQARRAVVNARHDLSIAYARTQAGLGTLLRALDLASLETGAEADLKQWSSGGDAAQHCPAEPITVLAIDKDALMQRAVQKSARLSMLNAKERAIAEVTAPVVATGSPEARSEAGKADEEAVKQALEAWRAAWASRNIDAYLAAYAPEFTPGGGLTREAWEKRRRAVIGRAADVEITVESLVATPDGPDRAATSFTQQYKSASYRDSVTKTIKWQKVDGRWLIVEESTTTSAAPAGK